MHGVRRTILVASGKGGVGKSTVACNLAVGLARRGHSVGLLDADLFGPSVPRLMGLQASRASVSDKGLLLPISNFGVRCMSMGFLAQGDARPDNGPAGSGDGGLVAWRGLMVMKGVQQLLWRVAWDDLDYLVIDTPPGTGDTHLTICQQLALDGAILVSTPQLVALTATEKGLLLLEKMGVSVLGLVENMKWLECEQCGHHNAVFDDHLGAFAKKHGLSVLASLPMSRAIAHDSDRGFPFAAGSETQHRGCYEGLVRVVEETPQAKAIS